MFEYRSCRILTSGQFTGQTALIRVNACINLIQINLPFSLFLLNAFGEHGWSWLPWVDLFALEQRWIQLIFRREFTAGSRVSAYATAEGVDGLTRVDSAT